MVAQSVLSNKAKYTIKSVKEEFGSRGFFLLENQYINNSTPMKYYCIKHPDIIRTKRLKDLIRGSGCPDCNKKSSPSIIEIKSLFQRRSYTLVSDKYINIYTKLEYICNRHPSETKTINWNDFRNGSGCFECGLEKVKESKLAEKNPNWNGGTSELNSWLRSCIDVWRKNNKYKLTTCFVTGVTNFNLEIHHSFSFHKIRDIVFEKLDLEKKEQMADYTLDQIKLIRESFLELHNKTCAVALNPTIHKLFHKVYGRDVRYSQLKEFKERYLRGEFKNGMETI